MTITPMAIRRAVLARSSSESKKSLMPPASEQKFSSSRAGTGSADISSLPSPVVSLMSCLTCSNGNLMAALVALLTSSNVGTEALSLLRVSSMLDGNSRLSSFSRSSAMSSVGISLSLPNSWGMLLSPSTSLLTPSSRSSAPS